MSIVDANSSEPVSQAFQKLNDKINRVDKALNNLRLREILIESMGKLQSQVNLALNKGAITNDQALNIADSMYEYLDAIERKDINALRSQATVYSEERDCASDESLGTQILSGLWDIVKSIGSIIWEIIKWDTIFDMAEHGNPEVIPLMAADTSASDEKSIPKNKGVKVEKIDLMEKINAKTAELAALIEKCPSAQVAMTAPKATGSLVDAFRQPPSIPTSSTDKREDNEPPPRYGPSTH